MSYNIEVDSDSLLVAIVIIVCFCTLVVCGTIVTTNKEQTKQIQAKYKYGDTYEEATEEKESKEN